MLPFFKMNINIPQTIINSGVQLSGANDALKSALSALNDTLVELPVDYESPLSPLAVTSSVADAVRDMLYKQTKIVALHPWVYGLGEQAAGAYSAPNMAYLSPKNAVLHLKSKLKDQSDNSKDRAKELVYILLSADKLEDFALQLDALSVVFPFVEIEFCLRRTVQLLELNETKFIRRSPYLNPYWKDSNIAAVQKNIAAKLESLTAFNDASATDISPITELQEVVNDAISEINDVEAAWTALDLSRSLTGAVGYFSGTASSIAEQLKSVSANDNKYSFLLAIIANTTGDLNFFREAFGI